MNHALQTIRAQQFPPKHHTHSYAFYILPAKSTTHYRTHGKSPSHSTLAFIHIIDLSLFLYSYVHCICELYSVDQFHFPGLHEPHDWGRNSWCTLGVEESIDLQRGQPTYCRSHKRWHASFVVQSWKMVVYVPGERLQEGCHDVVSAVAVFPAYSHCPCSGFSSRGSHL